LGTVVALATGTTTEVAANVGMGVSALVGELGNAVGEPFVGEPFVGGVDVCASAPLTAMSSPMKTTRNGTARSM
jgi:hypothetical protein